MRAQILAKIEQRLARVRELERERLIIQGEITAYEDALRYFPPDNPQPVEKSGEVAEASIAASAPPMAHPRRKRRLGVVWIEALKPFARTPNTSFGIDEILRNVMEQGATPTRGNVRSQLATYVDRGIVHRVADGEFRVTEKGVSEVLGVAVGANADGDSQ